MLPRAQLKARKQAINVKLSSAGSMALPSVFIFRLPSTCQQTQTRYFGKDSKHSLGLRDAGVQVVLHHSLSMAFFFQSLPFPVVFPIFFHFSFKHSPRFPIDFTFKNSTLLFHWAGIFQ